MIIVTGTKRSGTSMWMQILAGSGVELIGSAFPKNWKHTIEAANPHGFYESPLRRGVYYATNPDPWTGQYLRPDASRDVAVKVFIPGLCRTDLAYVRQVVATMRHWREYVASIERLHEMERAAIEEHATEPRDWPATFDPILEWWLENFALMRDLVTRGYPAHLVTYENVIEAPEVILPPILNWLGVPDVDGGIAAVSPETRTQDRGRIERSHPFEAMFDEVYDTIASREPISNDFLQRLNDTHLALIPAIEAEMRRIYQAHQSRAQPSAKTADPLNPDVLESLVHRAPNERP